MYAKKKIATNLPRYLLQEATKVTGLDQTKTIVEGLKELIARKKREALLSMRGKLHVDVDTLKTRARRKV